MNNNGEFLMNYEQSLIDDWRLLYKYHSRDLVHFSARMDCPAMYRLSPCIIRTPLLQLKSVGKHGFRSGRSCETQLVTTFQDLAQMHNKKAVKLTLPF